MAVMLHVLRALVSGSGGASGGACGVVFDRGSRLSAEDRQRLAGQRSLPEIVYVESAGDDACVHVYTPSRERAYAGYPLIATAWLLHVMGHSVVRMGVPAGHVPVRADADGAWLSLPLEWVHPTPTFEEVGDGGSLAGNEVGHPAAAGVPAPNRTIRWMWSDRAAREVVMRPTIPDHRPGEGISAAIALGLAVVVGTPLQVHQGNRSTCTVIATGAGVPEVGGGVVLDRVERIEF